MPTPLADIYRLGLQQAPEAAFRQFLNAQRGPQGGPFGPRMANYFAPAAAEAFKLSPFFGNFANAQNLANPVESLGSFTMGDFLGGQGAGGMALNPAFLDQVPNARQIREQIGTAGRMNLDPAAVGNNLAMQMVAESLADPSANFSVFDMVLQPLLGQSGGLFGPMIQKYLQAAFDRFQQATPDVSFLQALGSGTAGTQFSQLGGF